jgi:hypothetical protein
MLDAGYWLLDTRCWILVAGYSMLDTGYWLLDSECCDTGSWVLDTGFWMLDDLRGGDLSREKNYRQLS